MAYCHIVKDKRTGEKFLIPNCFAVINSGYPLPDREMIKQYCTCERPYKNANEKYVNLQKDEVISRILKLENRINKVEQILQNYKHELNICKEEVMLLGLEEEI